MPKLIISAELAAIFNSAKAGDELTISTPVIVVPPVDPPVIVPPPVSTVRRFADVAGVYPHGALNNGKSALVKYEQVIGPVKFVHDNGPQQSSPQWPNDWQNTIGVLGVSIPLYVNSGKQLIFGLPMLVGGKGYTLEAGAAGAYDQHWKNVAAHLLTYPQAIRDAMVFRLGWEFNGSWQPWFAGKNPGAFKAYFKRIVRILKGAVPKLKIVFCFSQGNQGIAADQCFPDNDADFAGRYVDIVSIDLYDENWNQKSKADSWKDLKDGPWGLMACIAFARSKGCQWGISECGGGFRQRDVGGTFEVGNGDNGVFAQGVVDVTKANIADCHHVSWFNTYMGESNWDSAMDNTTDLSNSKNKPVMRGIWQAAIKA